MPSSACDWSSDVCSSDRSEEHTSELQSRSDLVCRLLLEKKKKTLTLPDRPKYHKSMVLDPQNLQCTYLKVTLSQRSGLLVKTFMLTRGRSLVDAVTQLSA